MSIDTPRFRVKGPPLHHHDLDGPFYVMAGELTFPLGDEIAPGVAGTVTFAPRGSHHTVANLENAPAQYLLVCTPGSFERYFDPASTKPYPETIVVGPTIPKRLAEQRSAPR
jgi:uncharacterized cupin superfamily protein